MRALPFTLAILPGGNVRGTVRVLRVDVEKDDALLSYDWVVVESGERKCGTLLATVSELYEWTGWRP